MVPLVGSDLPVATNDEIGAIKVPARTASSTVGSMTVQPHPRNDTPAGTGPFTKVEDRLAAGHVVGGSWTRSQRHPWA